jgi:hypothetical protein
MILLQKRKKRKEKKAGNSDPSHPPLEVEQNKSQIPRFSLFGLLHPETLSISNRDLLTDKTS